uniref:Tc1-like transposase DDE domain-containing protein n=1 Tax=Oncorhynchus tshawytscha TaxID=74940 RepID=A0AAZ3R4Y1_ONCTS
MFQHDNAQPHVARICTQFLEAGNVPVLPWPAYSPDISPIEHVWDALDQRVRGKWGLHQVLTGFLIHAPTFFLRPSQSTPHHKIVCCSCWRDV